MCKAQSNNNATNHVFSQGGCLDGFRRKPANPTLSAAISLRPARRSVCGVCWFRTTLSWSSTCSGAVEKVSFSPVLEVRERWSFSPVLEVPPNTIAAAHTIKVKKIHAYVKDEAMPKRFVCQMQKILLIHPCTVQHHDSEKSVEKTALHDTDNHTILILH